MGARFAAVGLQADLDNWLDYYNNERTHQANSAAAERRWKHCLMAKEPGRKSS